MNLFNELKSSADIINADPVKIISTFRHDVDFYGCFKNRRYNDNVIRTYDEPDFTLESDVDTVLNVNSGCRILFKEKKSEDVGKFDWLSLEDYASTDIVIVSKRYALELNKSISDKNLKVDLDVLDRLFVLVKVADEYGKQGFKDVSKVFVPQCPRY